MRKEPRLRFTDEERADPALEKPIRKVDRAAVKADKAQAKIPKKQVRQKAVDLGTGKVTTKLVLEDKKKPPSKLSHAVRDAPGDAALGKLHKEIRETEQDNVGVESAHKSEEAVETGVRLFREGYRSHKLKPYRKAAQAEQKLEKANVNALYQKSLREIPSLPAIRFHAGSRNRPLKRNTPPPSAPVKLPETPPTPQKRPAKPPRRSRKRHSRPEHLLCATKKASCLWARFFCSSACCSTPCPPAP